MRVGVLFSGGKDSAYSAYVASQKDTLICLVTLRPRREDSYMFHFPNLRWTALQAESMSLPQVTFDTEGQKEAELDDLRSALKNAKEEYYIEGVYTGALASVYQKSRVDRICARTRTQEHIPHVGNRPAGRISLNIITWRIQGDHHRRRGSRVGRDLAREDARRKDGGGTDELQRKYGLHAALEGGEGETFVLDCPLFEKRIEIISSEKHWNGVNGFLEFLDARLVEKQP